MTEETHVSETIGNRTQELRDKIKELDGFDLAVLPFIYLYELGSQVVSFAKDKGVVDWVQNKFNGKVTQNTTPEKPVEEVSQSTETTPPTAV
tara:strand:- start:126 stop:401 length:276 start_codon:yes stop_codon:yes gene_type:complete